MTTKNITEIYRPESEDETVPQPDRTAVPPRSEQSRVRDHDPKYIKPKYEYAVWPTLVKHRLQDGRDWQSIISADNAGTGVGKSTLAVVQALDWDQNGWTTDKLFMNINNYLQYYDEEAQPGDVLVLDEATESLMSRRAMSTGNVEFIRALARNRSLQVMTIVVLPHVGLIDELVKVFADGWQHITRKGKAVNHFWYYKTYSQQVEEYVLKGPLSGGTEATYWKWNDKYQPYLDEIEAMKDEVRQNKGDDAETFSREDLAKKSKEFIRQYRNMAVKNVFEELGEELTQREIGKMFPQYERNGPELDFDERGLSQQQISNIIKNS